MLFILEFLLEREKESEGEKKKKKETSIEIKKEANKERSFVTLKVAHSLWHLLFGDQTSSSRNRKKERKKIGKNRKKSTKNVQFQKF